MPTATLEKSKKSFFEWDSDHLQRRINTCAMNGGLDVLNISPRPDESLWLSSILMPPAWGNDDAPFDSKWLKWWWKTLKKEEKITGNKKSIHTKKPNSRWGKLAFEQKRLELNFHHRSDGRSRTAQFPIRCHQPRIAFYCRWRVKKIIMIIFFFNCSQGVIIAAIKGLLPIRILEVAFVQINAAAWRKGF